MILPSSRPRRLAALASSVLAALLPAATCLAEESQAAALVPLPSVFDFTSGEGWGVALGAGVEYEAAYDGSDEYEVELDPAGAIQWRSGNHLLFWEGFELGWRGRLDDVWLLQAGARYESGLEPDDSSDGNLDGIEKRESHAVGFFEARRAFGSEWRNWVGARVMGGESGFGWLGIIAAGHRFGDANDGTGTEVYVYSTFGTDDFLNKDFGVSAEDATNSGLAEFALDGGYRSTGVNLVHRRDLGRSLQLVVAAEYEKYSSDISDSPIARDDFEYGIEMSLLWKF